MSAATRDEYVEMLLSVIDQLQRKAQPQFIKLFVGGDPMWINRNDIIQIQTIDNTIEITTRVMKDGESGYFYLYLNDPQASRFLGWLEADTEDLTLPQ